MIVEQGMQNWGQMPWEVHRTANDFLLLLRFVAVGDTSATKAALLLLRSAQSPLLHDPLLFGQRRLLQLP